MEKQRFSCSSLSGLNLVYSLQSPCSSFAISHSSACDYLRLPEQCHRVCACYSDKRCGRLRFSTHFQVRFQVHYHVRLDLNSSRTKPENWLRPFGVCSGKQFSKQGDIHEQSHCYVRIKRLLLEGIAAGTGLDLGGPAGGLTDIGETPGPHSASRSGSRPPISVNRAGSSE